MPEPVTPITPEPWADLKTTCRHTTLSESTIYHKIDQIPHIKAGGKLLFKLSEVDRWLES